MKALVIAIAVLIVTVIGGGAFIFRPETSPQQQALVDLAEAGGYEVHKVPGYNGAWWVSVEVPGCKNRVGLRSEMAPQDHVPTRYFVVRVGGIPREIVEPRLPDDASASTLKGFELAKVHLDCG